jgi:ABC-type bacteriocin/lantibiotic exporter with double-glycine peptidase domain
MKLKILLLLFITINLYSDSLLDFPEWWYKNQIGTGTGNCGPASAAMIVERSGTNITVQRAREIIGYKTKDGGTTIFELITILKHYLIKSKFIDLDEYYGIGVMIIIVNMKYISNRNYSYSDAHYLVIVSKLGDYYIVHDPLSGPNKIYKISEIKRGLLYKPLWIK